MDCGDDDDDEDEEEEEDGCDDDDDDDKGSGCDVEHPQLGSGTNHIPRRHSLPPIR